MTEPDPSELSPAELHAIIDGVAILKRYQHPDSWVAGEKVNCVEYSGCMLLRVEEFRVGEYATVTLEQAKQNAAAIVAFLRYLKLTRENIWLVSEPNKAPYLVVPTGDENWNMVLDMLQNL